MTSDKKPNHSPTLLQAQARLKARQLEDQAEDEAQAEQATLPGVPVTPKDTAPMGNELARTPLFAPIRRGRRKIHDMARLPSPEGIELYYFGKQLDTGDQDTYLASLMLAKGVAPDTPVTVNRAELLRIMGKKKSGKAYDLLDKSFMRVSTGRLFYDTPDEKGSTPLLGPLRYNKETEEYFFTVPKESLRAFGFNAFGFVDMEKRKMLSMDLAKWLQCYAVSHTKGEHKIGLAKLKAWSGFEGRTRQFRANLVEALAELARVGVLRAWKLYKDDEGIEKISWIR